jgi:hypothetical protein
MYEAMRIFQALRERFTEAAKLFLSRVAHIKLSRHWNKATSYSRIL